LQRISDSLRRQSNKLFAIGNMLEVAAVQSAVKQHAREEVTRDDSPRLPLFFNVQSVAWQRLFSNSRHTTSSHCALQAPVLLLGQMRQFVQQRLVL
jgi:hypothetical protein